MNKILGVLNEGFTKKYAPDEVNSLLEKSIKKELKKRGYDVTKSGVSDYIAEAVSAINETRKFHPEYLIEEYINTHKEGLTEDAYTNDELWNKFGTTDLDIINAGNEEDVTLKDTDEKEVFHNDNGTDYDVIERSSSGKNALLKNGKQWIVAWNCPEESGSWGQGHYFFDEAEARKVWKDKYVNESLKEDYTFGLDDSVKEYIKYMAPDDYQVDKIRPNLTFGDVLSNMLSKRGNLLGTYVDSALSQKVLNGLEEIIGTDKFDKVYNNWVNSPVRRNRKISRNESLKESSSWNWAEHDRSITNNRISIGLELKKRGYDINSPKISKVIQDSANALYLMRTDKSDSMYNPNMSVKEFVDWLESNYSQDLLSESLTDALKEGRSISRYFEPAYSKRYKVRGYFDDAYRGLSDSFDTDDFDEVRYVAHDYLSDGSYIIVNDYETGKTIKMSPDEYFGDFEGEGIQEYMFESAGGTCKKKMNNCSKKYKITESMRDSLPEDFDENKLTKIGTIEREGNDNRHRRIAMYKKYAHLDEGDEITEDNLDEYALGRVACVTNREPEKVRAELLGQRYSDYEI